jgi:hypothetical protein
LSASVERTQSLFFIALILAAVRQRHRAEIALWIGFFRSLDKYESDRREAERLDLEKHARLEAGLIDPVSATQPAPTVEHQHPESPSFWQAIKTRFK